jgi:hypothetical protein
MYMILYLPPNEALDENSLVEQGSFLFYTDKCIMMGG